MKKKISILIIIFIVVTMVIFLIRRGNETNTLGSSSNKQLEVLVSPTSLPKPQTFQFNESTDLEVELEKVDPAVYDSDFE